MVVILGLDQLTAGKVRESNKTMGEATNGDDEFHPGGTHNKSSSNKVREIIVQ